MNSLDTILGNIKRFIPTVIFNATSPAYHWLMALVAAIWYRFPSRHIKIIAVTGTKGKSSTVEILNAILEQAGRKTAVSNTIRFKIGNVSRPNLYKMSMPGRFFAQRFIREAVDAGCDYLIMEMTSQGSLLNRHRFIDLDAFIFTNISPEHIEAHGSYENYRDSKLAIAYALAHSKKKNRTLIVNTDDQESPLFLEVPADRKLTFSIKDAEPYTIGRYGLELTLAGRKVASPLSGLFNLYNILAAVTAARGQGIPDEQIIKAIEKFADIPGRVEKIQVGQNFDVIVDYAHTADSLEKFYTVFKSTRNICVLGGTGGGRDTWKRSEMGRIADAHCAEIILTDEDPYDEDPRQIIDQVAAGIKNHKPHIIMDRRQAIAEAIKLARPGDSVLITGKGTDPYIMGPKGTKIPWSDADIARDEIAKNLKV